MDETYYIRCYYFYAEKVALHLGNCHIFLTIKHVTSNFIVIMSCEIFFIILAL